MLTSILMLHTKSLIAAYQILMLRTILTKCLNVAYQTDNKNHIEILKIYYQNDLKEVCLAIGL